jgi:hypothetical protein
MRSVFRAAALPVSSDLSRLGLQHLPEKTFLTAADVTASPASPEAHQPAALLRPD